MEEKFILKRFAVPIILIASVTSLIYFGSGKQGDSQAENIIEVKEGVFKISVTSSGELMAEKSIDLRGPMLPGNGRRMRHGRGRRIRARNIKILDIVPEGTLVRAGDYIAQLDRTSYENIVKDELETLATLKTDLRMKMLDTAVILTDLRNDIRNQLFAVEEASLTLEQSKYEPPSVIRQAALALDKEKRGLKQKRKAYSLRQAQQVREISNIQLNLSGEARLVEDLKNYLAAFTITAPSGGMVIYKRNWNGTKRGVGYEINPFDMVVATLPDLSSMISRTFISETDIRKIAIGQKVNIKVDAFPKKSFSGTVITIGKIGEQLPNSDTKLFEVTSRINVFDPGLRPSMTTSNEIIIKSFTDAVYVPLEAVQADARGRTYVYTTDKEKQLVLLGRSNERNIIVSKGLEPGDEIFLSPPENAWKFRVKGESTDNDRQ